MNLNPEAISKAIRPHVKNKMLTFDDFEKIFDFLSQKEKYIVAVFVESKLDIFLVDEIEEDDADEDKKFVEFVLEKVQSFVESNQLTYDEFDELFGNLEKKAQYSAANILYELDIELVDEKILPIKAVEYEQPLIQKDAKDIKISNNMLVSLIQKGDKQARQDLCVKNYGLVMKYAQQYLKKIETCLTLEDLFQSGVEGMFKAAEKFDFDKDTQFTTYATWWINQAISRAIMETGLTVRVPVHMFERIFKVRRLDTKFDMLGKNYRERVELIAQELNLSVKDVTDAFMYSSYLHLKSLDEPLGEEQDTPRMDLLPDDTEIFPSPENNFVNTELGEKFDSLFKTLTPREEEVLKLRYGFEDGRERTLEEVGKFFNLTRERIRQIEAKALKKLRQHSHLEKLKDFWY